MTTLSEQLAEWTEGVQAARLPSEVILETKLRILDLSRFCAVPLITY